MITWEKHQTSKALFAAAGMYLVPLLILWSVRGVELDSNAWSMLIGGGILAANGVWARFQPLPPALISLALYVAAITFAFSRALPEKPIAWIVPVVILFLLIIAVVGAMRREPK